MSVPKLRKLTPTQRGNLQDAINVNTINNSRFSEKEMVTLFKGTCQAVRAMHDYQAIVPINSSNTNTSSAPDPVRINHSANSSTSTIRPSQTNGGSSNNGGYAQAHGGDEDEPEDDDSFPEPDGDAEGGFSYGGAVPLVPPRKQKEHGRNMKQGKGRSALVFDGDEELEQLNAQGPPEGAAAYDRDPGTGAPTGALPTGMKREHMPYAHRDIKPANVMLADDGSPVLMDFGSTVAARMYIRTRSEALTQQDLAAEQSTMTFRAPELFDVKTGMTLDEKVDIWVSQSHFSLRCKYQRFCLVARLYIIRPCLQSVSL